MTAPVQTQGPVDPTASTRAKLYAALGLLSGVVTFLQAINIVDAGQASGIASIVSGVTTLLSTFGFGLAASKVTKQVANGTFDAAPPASPAIVGVEGVKAMVDQVGNLSDAVAEGMQRMQDIANVLPGLNLGPLAQQIVQQGRTTP